MSKQRTILGIDAGSVAIGVVKVNAAGEFLGQEYQFHHGDIDKTLTAIASRLGLDDVTHVVATQSTPAVVAAQRRFDNQIAFIEAARRYHPDKRALLVVGGEKFFLSSFDVQGYYQGSAANTSCAAGTGSFLDQQAVRLKMADITDLSRTASGNRGDCPQIASRCAVFAKTDLIHAQQEGYGYAEISDGLCHGLAKNIVDTLFTGADLPGEILFCGGVSKNEAVASHIEKLTGVTLARPALGHLYGALGAVLCFLTEKSKQPALKLDAVDDLLCKRSSEKNYYFPPLELELSTFPDFSALRSYKDCADSANPVEVDIYHELADTHRVYLGIDIGSTSTKSVVCDETGEVLIGCYTRTAGRPLAAVQNIFRTLTRIEEENNSKLQVLRCATTGSGRKFIGKIVGADGIIDEITAHARAAYQLNPEVDTIIEIGGQDAKFTTLHHGRVTTSTMNNVCAAGTGSFIEEQAARLGCEITDYAARTAGVQAPMASDRCTVFMERDINHHLSDGFAVEEVLASALHAVRENYLMKVATEKNIGKTIFFQGATAKNKSLVAAFEQRLGKPILVSKFCHLTGALGAALLACEEGKDKDTSFKGLSLHDQKITITSEICELCNNHCKITLAHTPTGKVAYGFLCGREYDDHHYVKKASSGEGLLQRRQKLQTQSEPAPLREELTIGLPAAVHMVDDMYFWQSFFALLGIRTISGSERVKTVASGKKLSRSEFCAPIAAMHGQVDALLGKADYVFLPYYLENKSREGRRQFCYYTQYLPGVITTMGEDTRSRLLSPVIRYLYTSWHSKVQLYRMLQGICKRPPGFLELSRAYDQAVRLDERYRQALQDLFMETAGKSGDIEVVFLGRPYSLLSPAMNCGIPELFSAQGITTFFQDMVPYDENEVAAITPLLQEVHWHYSAKILEVAEVVAKRRGLYPVFVTSFKCSPDSFNLDYFKTIMEESSKPYLILELDEHDSSVGYETRIEAAVRSFRNHFQTSAKPRLALPDYRRLEPEYAQEIGNKNIVLPNWDRITCSFLAATLEGEGYTAYVMEESKETIARSLKYNTGQCIPLNAIAEGFIATSEKYDLDPQDTLLWLNESSMACNIKLYPHHIKTLLIDQGYGETGIYTGNLTMTDISLKAARNAYFSYMFGGLLRRVACRIRPYECEPGETDRVLDKSIGILADGFRGTIPKEEALERVISRFELIETRKTERPQVAIFGDLYVRDNRVMNQDLIRFIESQGGEVITTPYNEYAKMIAGAYFRKWFNEGKYFDVVSNKAILAAMVYLEKKYSQVFDRILGESSHMYDQTPEEILQEYHISLENTGESMDNILKIHYIHKYYRKVSLFVQASPALCCASMITEAMKQRIEEKTGIPVVSVVYDGTEGEKNAVITPYLKYGGRKEELHRQQIG
ncbi:MAG: acyl-CoA dehydratase activase [Desulfocapsaceae bacterium]|nr:acyl-CoA dehydratase activase [Desulfocapsaceae bacterium]